MKTLINCLNIVIIYFMMCDKTKNYLHSSLMNSYIAFAY